MIILKIAKKLFLIPVWFLLSIVGLGIKALVHIISVAKGILGLGITALIMGTIVCYRDWVQVFFLLCMSGILFLIVFAGVSIDLAFDLAREKIFAMITE